MLSGKGIAEPPPQDPRNLAMGKSRYRPAAAIAQNAQIIDAMAVIGVFVRPEHRIDPINFVVQQLHSQIWRGIDQQAAAGVAFNHDGDA